MLAKRIIPCLDVTAGRVQFLFTSISSTQALHRDGKLRIIAVAGPKQSVLPDVPSMAEMGYPGLDMEPIVGVMAPKAVPRDIINKLSTDINRVLAMPDTIERLAGAGVEPAMMSPEEFAAYIESETARYAKVVKSSGARLD